MFYLLNLLLVPIYWCIIYHLNGARKKKHNLFFGIILIHAVLFRALANPLNYTDTEGYAIAYENIATYSLTEALTSIYGAWGVGYVGLNWLLSRVSSDPYLLFFFLSVISVGGVLLFYKKTSYGLLASIMLYLTYPMLYYMSFGVVRQHFSIVFILYSLYYFDRFKISITFALTAILMHTSAIVFIPFYIWRKIDLRKKNAVVVASTVISCFVAMRLLMGVILSYLPRYLDEGFGSEGEANNSLPIILIGFTLFLLNLSKASKRLSSKMETNIYSFMLYGLAVSLFCFGLKGAGRFTLPFIYVLPVVITYIKKYGFNKSIYYYCYLISFFVFIIWRIYASYDPTTYDYISIWEKVKDYK